MSVYLPICLSIYRSYIYLSVYLSIYLLSLSLHYLTIYLFVYFFVYLSLCLYDCMYGFPNFQPCVSVYIYIYTYTTPHSFAMCVHTYVRFYIKGIYTVCCKSVANPGRDCHTCVCCHRFMTILLSGSRGSWAVGGTVCTLTPTSFVRRLEQAKKNFCSVFCVFL